MKIFCEILRMRTGIIGAKTYNGTVTSMSSLGYFPEVKVKKKLNFGNNCSYNAVILISTFKFSAKNLNKYINKFKNP